VQKSLLAILGLSILAVGIGLFFWNRHDTRTSSLSAAQSNKSDGTSFNKKQYSTTDPTSTWIIVNKKHPLPAGYTPTDLVIPNVPLRLSPQDEQMQVSSDMAPALEKLVAGAKANGINLKLSSGYRSETLQKQFFESYSARDGEAAATKYSARPGTSEHQTGLAADLMAANDKCSLEICFADTPEGQWLAGHAHEYGFIIRYAKDKEKITGYQYEPWHIRYLGNDLASQLYSSGQTIEEFFGYN